MSHSKSEPEQRAVRLYCTATEGGGRAPLAERAGAETSTQDARDQLQSGEVEGMERQGPACETPEEGGCAPALDRA